MKKLFTIGYEGTNPDGLFADLKRSGVRLLIDVPRCADFAQARLFERRTGRWADKCRD